MVTNHLAFRNMPARATCLNTGRTMVNKGYQQSFCIGYVQCMNVVWLRKISDFRGKMVYKRKYSEYD